MTGVGAADQRPLAAEGYRKQALDLAKLRALVREQFGSDDGAETVSIAGGAALQAGPRLWIYQSGATKRLLGRALAIAEQRQIADLHIIVDDGAAAALMARQSQGLDPAPTVWQTSGRTLIAAVPAPAPPAERAAEALFGGRAGELVELLRAAGAEIVVEHGEISGELRGLQIARIAAGHDGQPRLAVGVGRFDQEANDVMHADLPAQQALINAMSEVRVYRHRNARPHPVNRLARDRWLRAQLLAEPAIAGLVTLRAVVPGSPRLNVRDPVPAVGLGETADGALVLVVCSVGVDLELIPEAADLLVLHHAERVVVASPARDQLPLLRRLAKRLRVPVEFVPVEGDWPD